MSGARPAWPWLALLGSAKLLLHVALANRYGYFRDELYFLDCARHLDWGYVDHAPMIGLWAKIALLLGGSLPALRILPALAGVSLVALTGLLAWRLGGGPYAQGMAALAVLVAPIVLGIDSLLSMNAFEPLFWMGAVYVLLGIVGREDERTGAGEGGGGQGWIAVGVLLGLGLMNKHSTVFFGIALAAGLLLTRERRALRTKWPYLGAATALFIFLPNIVWQVWHDFPTLEDLGNVAREGKNVVLGPLDFLLQQIVIMHPVLFPLWLAGLVWLFLAHRGRYRMLGWTYLIFYGLLFALKGKNYYLAPIYPMLFAAGGVALESGLGRVRGRGRLVSQAACAALVLVAGAVTAPLALPLLDPEDYVTYEKTLGVSRPKTEVGHRGPLPQIFGDQFGWEELVADVARIYDRLPPEERARAGIFANNYGEAGAINLFGPRFGLPPAVSSHQTHFLWGPGESRGDIYIVLQDTREDLERVCASVEEAMVHSHPWGMAEENNPIYVCRGLKTPLKELWPSLKHWN